MVLTIFHFLLLALIFESLQIFTKSLETFQKLLTQSPLMKKLSLGNQRHVLVLLHSLLDFSCIHFMDFICGIFVDLATDYSASKTSQILHSLKNKSLFMRKVSLVYS